MNQLLSVNNLSIGHKNILQKNLNFSVSEGEILFIKGRNGAGKSTLIKTLCREIKLKAGEINWSLKKNEITTLPQLVTHDFPLSVTLGEVLLSFDIADDVINLLSHELRNRRFNDASGGEKQKALILSRLHNGVRFLILDEPFNHMDKKAINEVLEFLNVLMNNKVLKGIILISHVSVDFDNSKLTELELK
jgi:zinc/manganese transport system ATP-binding protein/zinc transport system ATP-binding protein